MHVAKKNLNRIILVRFSLLKIKPIIPRRPELRKLEDLNKRITCLITINHQSSCLRRRIYDERRVPLNARVTTVAQSLRAVTGGPHPSGLPTDFNLKPLDYSGLASADSIIKIWLNVLCQVCYKKRFENMFCGRGAQSRSSQSKIISQNVFYKTCCFFRK